MMKFRHLILALFAVAILGAVGCAGTPTQPEQAGLASSSVDYRYMSEVERQARRSGVKVRWVNPPRRMIRQTQESQESSERF